MSRLGAGHVWPKPLECGILTGYVLPDRRFWWLLAVLKPNRIIHKRTNANYSRFHLRVFLGISNPQGQRQTSTLSISSDDFGERKTKFNLDMSRTTLMQLYKCIHVP
jgi:hypothetical protein